jgi:DME family drug/metabolite transporter
VADLSQIPTHRGSVLAVVAAAVLFGTTGTAQALASDSLGYDLDPLAVGSARVVLAAAGVAAGTMIALGSGPAFTGVLQYLVDRRRPGPLWFLSTVVAVAGMTLIVAGQPGDDASNVLAGAVPALIAGLGYAVYTVAGAHMITAGVSTQGAMGQMFGIGGILLLPILIWQWPGGLGTSVRQPLQR